MAPITSEDTASAQQSPTKQHLPNGLDQQPTDSILEAQNAGKARLKGRKGSQGASDTGKDSRGGKLSGKELKERKKAEKAAKREEDKQNRQGQPAVNVPDAEKAQQDSYAKSEVENSMPTPPAKLQHRRKSSAGAHTQKSLPLRPGASESKAKPEEPKKEEKRVAFLEHLYGHPRRHTIAGASKDIHPSVLALGLQLSSYEILGSSARCVATLLVLQEVITAYTTPLGHALPRHLTTHLATQIDYLVSCRPLSVSQGNAIRDLKVKISAVDISTPEQEAKHDLCEYIDNFIRERIVVADEVIASSASERIKDGDVIMTYARSSVVQKTLLEAHRQGKKFKVIVVDSRPLFEGKQTARTLVDHGIEVQYSLMTGLSHVAPTATKTFLGAHAMMANGRLYSRVGTAMVAMMAKDADLPVVVCCESIKFTDRVALDCFVHNELAPEDELIPQTDPGEEHVLERWRDVKGLQLLNMMYDLTPAEFVDLVITENGNVPPH